MKLLLFSNSTNTGEEYLKYTLPYINDFTGTDRKAVFIPFAGISIGFDPYFQRVSQALKSSGLEIQSLHHLSEKQKALKDAEIIIVGGGNTFALLGALQDHFLLDPLREKVIQGTKYIGWSAGANLACPTIMTTNDMPIIEPQNFNALNLVPFQINPHYTDFVQPGHAGETREMRIGEFLIMNRDIYVAGLREGTLFHLENSHIDLMGNRPCRIFKYGSVALDMMAGENFDFLLG
jgi:dipeptidase E